ncbi:uncharacterized protein C9orf50 homolog isoform X11 [Peromyscus eremicus]|uniref:uncharacterized protein C9orf50 homolog isoform X11 n=1 Tax=Peromyscus eremicus TaxID=42410 RepID=UPI0027DE334F|nr:uncharacterized protein C9orf50 homolog isoform X11 [Peromyscus eremicus]
MSRRQPAAETPAYEPKGCPNGAAPRRRTPLLPRLFTPDLRTGRQSAGMWWQDCERLPYLSPGIPYGPRGRGTLRALLLPPLLPSGTAQGAGARGAGARGAGARGAGARETRQPAARDNPDTFGVLLGKFLPTKFRDFLHQLRAKSAEPEAHPPSAPQYPKGASEHYLDLCPSCSFLPDLWDQSLHSEDSFKEKTTLGPPRGEFITARKANPSGDGGMIPPITQHMIGRRKLRSGALRTVCPSSHGLRGTMESDNCPDSLKLEMFPLPCILSAGSSCSPPYLFTPVLRKGSIQDLPGAPAPIPSHLPQQTPQHTGPQSEDSTHSQPLWRRLQASQTLLSFPGAICRRDPAGHGTPLLGAQPCSPAEYLSM